MDVVFKLEARQLGSALGHRFGFALPPVVRYFPTEVPVADVHLEQLDAVFELADGSLLYLEFQTVHRLETLLRFLLYDIYLYQAYQRVIHTAVFYGAGVAVAPATLSFGAVHYQVSNVLLGQEDGEATYARLRDLVDRQGSLGPDERLDLIFLLLMRHSRPRREVVQNALALARHLPSRQQEQTLAALVGLGHRFLSEDELQSVLEGLMSTSLGQRLIERGREQCLVQGREQGLREAILRVLTRRFGPVPATVNDHLGRVEDVQRLEALLDSALAASNLGEFTQALG
jgi:hypothetical protein